jgi:hypothetical protein
MEYEETFVVPIIVLVSEVVALWLIWKLWRSDDHLFFKVSLSLLAFLPVLGPLLVIWIGNFPDSNPHVLQDRLRFRADVYDRWRHVLEQKNPTWRFRYWRELMDRHRNKGS